MFDYLIGKIYAGFRGIKDHRKFPEYELADALMSGLAVFSLKDPSLLSFIDNYETRKENLEQVFQIKSVPTAKGLRKILDPVNPQALLPIFKTVLEDYKVKAVLKERLVFPSLGGYLAIAVDGTTYFCSTEVNCPHCLKKVSKSGEVQYYHQLVGACIVKADEKTVFPVFVEPITCQDGADKNDCEHNAFKRLVPKLNEVLPMHRKVILLDALFADGPAIRSILANQQDFITVVKDGYVLVQAHRMEQKQELKISTWTKNKHFKCTAKWANGLILNGANQDILVNYLQYEEIDLRSGKVVYTAKWITSLPLQEHIIQEFVDTARAKWKIENETFNVLKNHGYALEHNYGHGKQFLSSLFALLMFLAFLVDQITQSLDSLFNKALVAAHTLRDLRQKIRVLFDLIPCLSMNFIYKIIAKEIKLKPPP